MGKNGFFIIDCETHLGGELVPELMYFPRMRRMKRIRESGARWWLWPGATMKDREVTGPFGTASGSEDLIKSMDRAGVDISCVMAQGFRAQLTGNAYPQSTNGYVYEQIKKYPDRMVGVSWVNPILQRGVENALEELEVLHTKMGFKATKLYAPEDTYINDPKIYPFYEKCIELKIPVFMHTGCFGIGVFKYSHPILLDDVCWSFPDLPIVAYHYGYPYWEQLLMAAQKYENLYVSVSGQPGWWYNAPMWGRHMIGLGLYVIGSEQMVFGTDWHAAIQQRCVDAIVNLEIPKKMQREWGYPEFTNKDKWNLLGGTLAKILNIPIPKNLKPPKD